MGYEQLERSLIDIMKEEQAKLGYRKEQVRLYYPLSSLNHFFGTEDHAEDMQKRLSDLPGSLTEKLGEISVSHVKDRFCFHIPEEGSEYVHAHMQENEFIKTLVELLQQHHVTMEQIRALFKQHSEHVIMEEIHNGEFDYLLRFADDKDDPYYYCFKDEGCHMIYHRFLPADYKDFGF